MLYVGRWILPPSAGADGDYAAMSQYPQLRQFLNTASAVNGCSLR
jgi:hypothetical protein